MPIKRIDAYQVVCDGCGQVYYDYSCDVVKGNRIEAIETIENTDWEVCNDKVYCPRCAFLKRNIE